MSTNFDKSPSTNEDIKLLLHSNAGHGEHVYVVESEDDSEDFGKVDLERVSSFTSPLENEVVWKSIAVLPPQQSIYPADAYQYEGDLSAAKCGNIAKPQLSRRMSSSGSSNGTNIVTYIAPETKEPNPEAGLFNESTGITYKRKRNVVPSKPFLLMPTHVICDDDLVSIVDNLNQELGAMSEVSFEYSQGLYKWTAICLQLSGATGGASSCKMQIQIYSNGSTTGDMLSPVDSESYIIEFNRLSGDHAPFRTAFNKIKSLFNQTESAFTEEVRYSASAPPSMHDSLSSSMSTSVPFFDCLGEEEAHEALDSVLKMGREKKVDTQIEAARIFCDLSSNEDDIFQQLLCESESMKVLLDLAGPESPELARQYIFMALANLSMHHGHCQERIIDAGALPTILPLVSNGSYESAEMRREGARILANLSGGLAARVVNELGHASVSTWMNTVDNLADERVRLHAMQARDQLTGLVV